MPNRPNDPHFKFIEESRHREHMARREHARDDGTLTVEQGESMLQTIRYRRKIAALKAQNDDLRRQLDEVTK